MPTTKAVRIAENRPAYEVLGIAAYERSNTATYEHKERVDIVVQIFNHSPVVILSEKFLDMCPLI